MHQIVVIPGDGIGPEIVEAAVKAGRKRYGSGNLRGKNYSWGPQPVIQGTFFSIFLIESPVIPVKRAVVLNYQNPH
jgi:hypothetical protein